MKKSHLPAIRALLRQHEQGLTAKQIHQMLPHISKWTVVKSALRKMPDVYIDRWCLPGGTRGQFEAVWCAVIPPAHCPHPADRFYQPKTTWVNPQGENNVS